MVAMGRVSISWFPELRGAPLLQATSPTTCMFCICLCFFIPPNSLSDSESVGDV